MARTKIDASLLNPLTGQIRAVGSSTASSPAYSFDGDPNTGMYRPSADILSLCVAGSEKVEITNANGVYLQGTTTNDSAPTGNVGEYVSSVVGNVSAPTTGQYKDITSISLTAGDWDVSINTYTVVNSAVQTNFYVGISTTTGNSATGLVAGDSVLSSTSAIGTGTANAPLTIAQYRMSFASTTTVYGKLRIDYASGTPSLAGTRLSARRVR